VAGADFFQQFAGFGELVDLAAVEGRDPDVAFGVDGDPFGIAERGAFAPLADEFAFFVELLDAAVVGVGDPDVAFGVDGEGRGGGDLPVAGAVFAEGQLELACLVELLDSVVVLSITKRLPLAAAAIPEGCSNWPLPVPSVPKEDW
jgi:hypothetical protein